MLCLSSSLKIYSQSDRLKLIKESIFIVCEKAIIKHVVSCDASVTNVRKIILKLFYNTDFQNRISTETMLEIVAAKLCSQL